MDKILLFLFLITIILSFITIFNNTKYFENFEETTNSPNNSKCFSISNDTYKKFPIYKFNPSNNKDILCQEKIRQLIQNKSSRDISKTLGEEYTISLVFKSNYSDNDIQHLISLNNKWIVGIQKQILFFIDHNKKHEPIYVKLNSDIDDINDIDPSNSQNKYNHLAITSHKQNNNYKYELFVNGIKGYIVIAGIDDKNLNDLFIGSSELSIKNFNGSILDIIYESKKVTELELCSRWKSCGTYQCSYDAKNATDLNDCYSKCKETDDCSENDCKNKCYNENISDWRPKCKFSPEGNSVTTCVDQCYTIKNCRYDDCEEICKLCKDYNKCSWLNEDKYKKYKNELQYDINNLEETRILPPILKIEVKKNKTITIHWEHPYTIKKPNNTIIEEYDKNISMFIFIVNKSNKPDEGNEMYTIHSDIINYNSYNPKTNSKMYNTTLKNLDKEQEYNIICKSVKPNPDTTDTENNIISDNSYSYSIIPSVYSKIN